MNALQLHHSSDKVRNVAHPHFFLPLVMLLVAGTMGVVVLPILGLGFTHEVTSMVRATIVADFVQMRCATAACCACATIGF